MSLLTKNELRVVLCHNQLQLVHVSGRLTLKGWAYQVLDKQIHSFGADPDMPWSMGVNKLETVLSGLDIQPESASIVLSDYFLRYAIVDADPTLHGEAEQIAYVKYRFGELYGESADSWELRLDQEYPGAPFFVSSVEGQLIADLRETFAQAHVRLQSIQPCLMRMYNQCRAEFKNRDAWFILFEHDSLCMVWLKNGRPNSVRKIRVADDWLQKLPEIIERETCLSGLDTEAKEVFLWSFDQLDWDMRQSGGRWKFIRIQPAPPSGLQAQYDEQYALAMCGV
ncbi:MAG: hypothetical protein HY306_06250 [Nitrosomonadales bacterium]|nr:hypothetical protein [Nitrosomonadales bacterium]